MDAPEKPFIEHKTMTSEDRATQSKVGIFILIGLVTIGAMVVYFGRLGEGVRSYYNLRVEFPNASGLLRGAEVLLAGAKIGRVETSPTMLPNLEGVYVNIRVLDDVHIPSASEFLVGSSGLLGDKYVEIHLKPNAKDSPPIEPGSTVKGGKDGGGLSSMADGVSELLPKLKAAVENIDSITKKIDTGVLNEDGIKSLAETLKNIRDVAKKVDTGVLSDEGVKSLADTLKNLQTTSTTLAATSGKIDSVVAKVDKVVVQAESTIASGQGTMDSARKAADELQRALADIRGLLRDVKQGQGALGTLISNRETADNLRSLIANLRRYGILWYRDGEKGKSPAPPR